MKMEAWIQTSDFSIREHGAITLASALQLLQKHDWKYEEESECALNSNGHDACRSGLGLEHPDGHQLWIRPRIHDESCWITCTILRNYRLFGFLTIPLNLEYDAEPIDFVEATEFVRQFYDINPIRSKLYSKLPFRLLWSDILTQPRRRKANSVEKRQ